MKAKNIYLPIIVLAAFFTWFGGGHHMLGVSNAHAQSNKTEPGSRPDEAIEGEITTAPSPSADPGASPEIVEKTITFLDVEIIPKGGTYATNSDANIRNGPGTEFEVLSGIKQGEYVYRVGQPEGKDWFAIATEEGKALGFIYSDVLVPVVDGTLKEETRGVIMQKNIVCEYRLRFEGKSTVEGGEFDTSDYEIRFRCAGEGGRAVFYSHMFLTEAAVNKSFHQISMDVRSIGDGMEEYLTTGFLYNPASGELRFDGHSIPKFAIPPNEEKQKVKNLQEALIAVMKTSVLSWTQAAWDRLFAKSTN